ncbi:glycosyltransferase [Flavobacterium psychrophilum]|uniref:glycosyltransferase family 2 protein n=1 Tax=Flavobacterium psychrophilum TaxID=96345 RepID=UPI0004F73EC4|nr:glycosyltransferase [Flavobacterium psychrophilum]AIN75075.1 hypothetical protein FPG3_03060 [Flavobacterium psychrophilum FPG3]EKT2069376.1 glycosyltransferase [Flavobacterium psychrophilum]EKT2071640.1 glycosyltransferase [Flavobacterium psychrophilum]EKT3965368.1 glycosyltransferase [Flavobacterium psychrophilum]EKT4491161.1 glycosyltransferase [Flavobacterium psychrophilum]
MNKPLLSIAIATKDREKYCIAAIQSILSYKATNIEIAIADNSETTLVKEFVEKLNSTQVKYRYDSGGVSSIENFNRAVELTTGEYLILIGDDDIILPKAIEMAKWAKENDIDSICSKETVTYYWPKSRTIYPNGHLILPYSTGRITKIDVKKHLVKLLKNGLQLYLLYPLPKTYHGIVRKALMDEVKSKTGHYYGGLSPDIYSCVVMSCLVKNHYVVDEPLTVAGVCPSSTTADNFTGKHSGSIANIPHLKNRGVYVWNNLVPKYYSVNTIWAESGLTALEELKQTILLNDFNVYKLLVQGWINNNKFIPDLIREENEKIRISLQTSIIIFKFNFFKALSETVIKKIIHVVQGKLRRKAVFAQDNVRDFSEVLAIYRNNIK